MGLAVKSEIQLPVCFSFPFVHFVFPTILLLMGYSENFWGNPVPLKRGSDIIFMALFWCMRMCQASAQY